jgi:hypothetical protein
MKISVKYGLFLAILVFAIKMGVGLSNLELHFAIPELAGIFILFLAVLILCIRKTQEAEYNGGAMPMELLRAGLITSAIFAVSFSFSILLVKLITHDLPGSTPQLIFGFFFFSVFVLVVGGMLSVFIAYIVSRKKS